MADLVITAASVLAGSESTTENGTAGAVVTAGQVVSLDPATGKLVLTDADGVADIRRPRGVALNSASANQPLRILKAGDLTVNAVLTAGVSYFASPTPGGIAPRADVLTGDYVTHIGIARSTTVLAVDFQWSGVVSA